MAQRVLLAGLFHETHTFLEGTTPLADFMLRRGDELFAVRGDGSPLAGALQVADDRGWEVIPTVDLRATPSATADDAVFHAFWSELEPALREQLARGLDGIYLVLHGAMVTQSLRDVEGALIARIPCSSRCRECAHLWRAGPARQYLQTLDRTLAGACRLPLHPAH